MTLSRRSGQRFQASIWPGFVDAMTGLLLVLFFVLTIFMVVQFVLRETISGQETELDALGGEVAALAQALGLAETRGSALETQLGALNATLSDAQAEAARQAALNAALTSERDETAAALADAQSRVTAFEAQVAALLSERDQALQRVGNLEADQTRLLNAQEALDLALAQARSEIDAGAEAARLAAARREALEALVQDLEDQNAQTSRDLAKAETALDAEETARLTEAAAAQALRDRLSSADAELTAMTLALEKQRKQAEETLTLLAAAKTAQGDLDTRLTAALLAAELAEREQKAAIAEADNARAEIDALASDRARIEAELAQLLEENKTTNAAQTDLRSQLAEALAAKLAAETRASDRTSEAEKNAALLAAANQALTEENAISTKAQRQAALLNQQVAALRAQLGELQGLLDVAAGKDADREIQLQSLGAQLNTALARVAAEERRRREAEQTQRELEEAERVRLEAEARRLAEEAQDLEKYRSEFFGQLRDLLGAREGVRIVGDRFVFSSEVLFPPAQAELSSGGQEQIARIVVILRGIMADIPTEIDWVLQVDGHTDDQPLSGRGEFADNWELSQARALSVVKYMIDVLGMPPSRLSANGFGEFQPINAADTVEARAQNRRIEIKFTEK